MLSSDLLNSLDAQGFTERAKAVNISEWVKTLLLNGQPFQTEGHWYQADLFTSDAKRQCYMKGSQMGFTQVCLIQSLYGQIVGTYKQGVLYLMPSTLDVGDLTKSRFNPLIQDNPKQIGVFVQDTDAVSIKKVGKSMLYLRGARSTSKIEGIKRSSSQLKSIPVDRVVFDECDEMDPAMIDLALERMGHSEIQEEIYLSTPSIPDFGIDKLYQDSDQRIWMIRCQHCGTETCLELEFPGCLVDTVSGVIRGCKKCKKEIYSRDGHWVARYPERSKDMVGWWISQLNSAYIEPGAILKAFNEPPHGNLTEVYCSKLGMAYIPAENRLTTADVYACCGQDAMLTKEKNPCAMGVDIGRELHVVVGFRAREGTLEVCYLARVTSFNDVHDIAKRFNVQCAVVDMEPETRKARDFQESESFEVFLCDYIHSIKTGPQWDESKLTVKVHRTETLDASHELFTKPGSLILPRRSDEVDIFALQSKNTAKVLEEDQETGSREFKYRKLGPDHYRHSLNYFWLAAQRIRVADSRYDRFQLDRKSEIDFDPFEYSERTEGWK